MAEPVQDITSLLSRINGGDRRAADVLLPLVYDELRALAGAALSRERSNHTLQATALVHEVYLKMVGQDDARFHSRVHFLRVASQAMRRILVDHARTHSRKKRGGGWNVVSLELAATLEQTPSVDMLQINDVLNRLATFDPEAANMVEMRYFGGLTMEQIAMALDTSKRSLERLWVDTSLWLSRELGHGRPHDT